MLTSEKGMSDWFKAKEEEAELWTSALIGGVLWSLFNPLIPVYATREFWVPFDFAGFVLFWGAGVKLRASKPAPPAG